MTKEEMREWMIRNGYSRDRIAREIGVAISTVGNWLYGRRAVPNYAIKFFQRIEKNAKELRQSKKNSL
jgi:transcriptional regulator with XRE-family HTH domain